MFGKRFPAVLAACLSLGVMADEADIRKGMEAKLGTKVESVTKSGYMGLYEVYADGNVLYTDEKMTAIMVGAQLIGVRVRGPANIRARAAEVENLDITAPDGRGVRVGQIAEVSIIAGQKQLTREDLAPFIDVTARLENRDLGTAMSEVRSTVAGLRLPPSIRVDYGGLFAQQRKSFADMTMVFAAALLLAALLLTVLFENIAWTLAAVVTVLLSTATVFAGLWLSGIELDISALMGLTMVVGMATELIVFYFSELDTAVPVSAAALAEAGEKRLRPILMSALIAILTLSPLALGISRGAGLQQPLATAIIFGLVAAVPLVLLLLPALMLAFTRPPAGRR